MSRPLFSIITPSYNQCEFIEENIRSVKNQPLTDVEHIVVDGGSTDGTIEVLERHADEYDLRWVSESDRGQTHALNKGFEMANGEWLGWQNSDDFYVPGAFERAQQVIADRPGVDVVYGDVIIADESGDEIDRVFSIPPTRFVQRYWSLYASNQATFFHSRILDGVGGLNEELEYTMDADLYWRLLDTAASFHHIKAPLGAWRSHEGAKTYHDDIAEQRAELDDIYDHPIYERVVPNSWLRHAAKAVKLMSLLRSGHWQGVRHNVAKRL